MIKDFINIKDFTGEQLNKLLDLAIAEKAAFKAGKLPATLRNKTLAMIFEKPSLRTRVSFETAMTHLGGHAVYLSQADIGLGSREAVQDIARVLGRMCNAIMARTFNHEYVEQLGTFAPVPVINGLTDYSHPCQAMADLMTVQQESGKLAGRTMLFIGDGNNVALSLAAACAKLKVKFILASPEGYELQDEFVGALPEEFFRIIHDPRAAVAEADAIYTDTWVSMGQEAEKDQRAEHFKGFQVNADLLAAAPDGVIVLHCLPAKRGLEITDDVFEAHSGTIFAEAENRLHFQRTLLNVLIGKGGIE
ncbi:MAG: ornithine carbamoyltransferase [Planctomycetota bacterium]|nr:ornithine carbamoyltransferase [Planctomycetota bacterium]